MMYTVTTIGNRMALHAGREHTTLSIGFVSEVQGHEDSDMEILATRQTRSLWDDRGVCGGAHQPLMNFFETHELNTLRNACTHSRTMHQLLPR